MLYWLIIIGLSIIIVICGFIINHIFNSMACNCLFAWVMAVVCCAVLYPLRRWSFSYSYWDLCIERIRKTMNSYIEYGSSMAFWLRMKPKQCNFDSNSNYVLNWIWVVWVSLYSIMYCNLMDYSICYGWITAYK